MNTKPIYIHGDNHGDWNTLFNRIDEYGIGDCTLINVGDCGFGFKHPLKEASKIKKLNAKFADRNINYLCIRGNHDDPSCFHGQHNYSHLRLLRDYHTEELNGLRFLFVGGAVSVDRIQRTPYRSYWYDEEFVLDESKIVECDVCVTHSAPQWIGPADKAAISGWLKSDKLLEEDCNKERLNITRLLALCKARNHYCGHFHESHNVTIDGCNSKILSIDEFTEHR
jgi:hypothetical protein